MINPFEEIFLRRLRDKSIDIAKRIFLRTDTDVRRDDDVYITKKVLEFLSTLGTSCLSFDFKLMLYLVW